MIWISYLFKVDCYYNPVAKSKNYSNLPNNFKYLSRLKNNKFSRFFVSNTRVIQIKTCYAKTLRNGLHRWYYGNIGHVCPSENSRQYHTSLFKVLDCWHLTVSKISDQKVFFCQRFELNHNLPTQCTSATISPTTISFLLFFCYWCRLCWSSFSYTDF